MLAHRFKELLALANQAGKGFASEHPLDLPGYEFRSGVEQSLRDWSGMKYSEQEFVEMQFVIE